MKKICRRCGIEKDLSEYYKHAQMKDGHLNICMICKKGDAINQYSENMQDFEWKIKERKRTRERNIRLGYWVKNKPSASSKKKAIHSYFEKYPEKLKAQSLCGNIKNPIGKEKHHWSYNNSDLRDITFLAPVDHNKLHCYIEYFQPAKMHKTIFGEPLYTKDRFIKFMDYVLSHDHDEIINEFYRKAK